MRRSRRGKRF